MNIIKSALLCSAATLAIASANAADLPSKKSPANAFTQMGIDAFVSAGFGYSWAGANVDGESVGSMNGVNFETRATFAAPLTGAIGIQADGEFVRNSNRLGDMFDRVEQTGSLAGHVFARNNTGLLGVIAQGNSTTENVAFENTQHRRYFLGAEGQYFLGKTTIYGQAAYQNLSYGSGIINLPIELSFGGMNLSAQVRHFMEPNWMAALKVDYQNLTGDGLILSAVKQTAWRVGARTEYRLDASPISVYGDLSHAWNNVSFDGSYKENETRAMAGIKLNFGTSTLFERDRSGASLEPIRPSRLIGLGGLGLL